MLLQATLCWLWTPHGAMQVARVGNNARQMLQLPSAAKAVMMTTLPVDQHSVTVMMTILLVDQHSVTVMMTTLLADQHSVIARMTMHLHALRSVTVMTTQRPRRRCQPPSL